MATRRIMVRVTGRVQGVGFRPFVYRQAVESGLSGWVLNASEGVAIEAEGPSERIEAFLARLRSSPPPQARVEAMDVADLPPGGARGFEIRPSARSGDVTAGMPPDLAACPACLADIADPANRRHRYPFTNCTDCGPRFTIIRSLPYDRERTSMASFRQCPACAREYADPSGRRFDAQPNACPACGPRLRLVDPGGGEVEGDPIAGAAGILRAGAIVAVKGLGGYHLACDARSEAAVCELRRRKRRLAKPLAVMFASTAEALRYCEADDDERVELESVARPVVVLRRRPGAALALSLAPDTPDLGSFLPYTPLHHLLLREISPLVMTSGNAADEPIARDESELGGLLGPVADAALVHDLEILRRCDDSVLKVWRGGRLFFRRSRGFVPEPIRLPAGGPSVLACGGDSKSVFAVTRGRDAFLSPHIGDLDEYRSYRFYEESVTDFERLLAVRPAIVACDLHPDYVSSRYARRRAGVRVVEVQHHHAHMAAVMAEHGLSGAAIGVSLDGTGYGPDGTIWGGEFLVGDLRGYRRAGHFKPYRMPGGEEAVREPRRMALSVLTEECPRQWESIAARLLGPWGEPERQALAELVRRGVRSPWTSSAGRLFDAVSALLGLCQIATYDGQAAVRLQAAAASGGAAYPFTIDMRDGAPAVLSFGEAVREIVEDVSAGVAAAEISARFHQAVADGVVAMCERIGEAAGIGTATLSGGVFQNDRLLGACVDGLKGRGFTVYHHRAVSPNDSGLALGQAAVALASVGER